jgi:hypothetical protein
VAHLADIAFGIIIGDRTHGTRYGKKEDRYRIIGVMGLRFDGLKLVPCSLSDYVEDIASLGDTINENSYLCISELGIEYYGIENNGKYLPPLFGILPVYDKDNNYLFTCGASNIVEIRAPYCLVLKINTETLDYTLISSNPVDKKFKSELFFYKSQFMTLTHNNLISLFERESYNMLMFDKCCLFENCGSSAVVPSWCEHCIFVQESDKTTSIVFNKALKYIYIEPKMVGGIKNIYMSKDSSEELVSSILYWFIFVYVNTTLLLDDRYSKLVDTVADYYDTGEYKYILNICYDAEYSLCMEEILKNVEFEFY